MRVYRLLGLFAEPSIHLNRHDTVGPIDFSEDPNPSTLNSKP